GPCVVQRAPRSQPDAGLRRLRHQPGIRGGAMTLPRELRAAFAVAGRGEAEHERRDTIDSQARAAIRYADASAWITATAAVAALALVREPVNALRHRVGVVTVSREGPGDTMAA